MDSTRNLIDYAMDSNGVEFRNELYASIHDRVTAAIESKKQELAGSLIRQEAKEEDEEGAGHENAEKKMMKSLDKNKDGKHTMADHQKESVEPLDEGKMEKMTLSGLWHKHGNESYHADQGYGIGAGSMKNSSHAATAIENHVRKHYGNKVADDMVSHSDHSVAHAEYAGPGESEHHEKEAEKLRKKHGIGGSLHGESYVREENEEVNEASLTNRFLFAPGAPTTRGGTGAHSYGIKPRQKTIEKRTQQLKDKIKGSLGTHTRPNLPEENEEKGENAEKHEERPKKPNAFTMKSKGPSEFAKSSSGGKTKETKTGRTHSSGDRY
jgi:hypothetical protein